jgi:hypothetical protein
LPEVLDALTVPDVVGLAVVGATVGVAAGAVSADAGTARHTRARARTAITAAAVIHAGML